jgi:putative ABC transport system permease protein
MLADWRLLKESFRFSLHALLSNKVRTLLTALGMVIGNASVILVVTISLSSRDYILDQISGIGSNLIYAYFDLGTQDARAAVADFVKISDLEAVRRELGPRIRAATGVMVGNDTIVVNGVPRSVMIIGTDQEYAPVRGLVQVQGRALDALDVELRLRVGVMSEQLAARLYGSAQSAVGQTVKIQNLQFTVVGTFRERTETFGLTEIAKDSILIPMTVFKYFAPYERIDPLYVQARSAADVAALTDRVHQILVSRHRPGARYYVANLSSILEAAESVGLILTIVLILFAAIALIISGIGIMNIMLVTVTERTREIGVRLALGATRVAIRQQFLTEALILSMGGGLLGVLAGVAVPLAVARFVSGVAIEISWVSVVVAFVVSAIVGVTFGLLPANRAARLNPTEALRHE